MRSIKRVKPPFAPVDCASPIRVWGPCRKRSERGNWGASTLSLHVSSWRIQSSGKCVPITALSSIHPTLSLRPGASQGHVRRGHFQPFRLLRQLHQCAHKPSHHPSLLSAGQLQGERPASSCILTMASSATRPTDGPPTFWQIRAQIDKTLMTSSGILLLTGKLLC
jgi:hypothetical protein